MISNLEKAASQICGAGKLIESITLDTLESIESLVSGAGLNSSEYEDTIPTSFRGMFILKIYPEGDMKCNSSVPACVTENDERRIKEWISDPNRCYFFEDYYRVDLEKYIFIFKMYSFNRNKMFIGHVLSKTIQTRIMLIELQQTFLTGCIHE